jgi:hypothetical protein
MAASLAACRLDGQIRLWICDEAGRLSSAENGGRPAERSDGGDQPGVFVVGALFCERKRAADKRGVVQIDQIIADGAMFRPLNPRE